METKGSAALKNEGHFTVRQWRSWPENERWELIHGFAYAMSPAPRLRHQRLIGTLYAQLDRYFQGKPCEPFLSPVDVYLPDADDQEADSVDTVVQPDLMVVCDPEKCREEGIFGAPDWVLEILSPTSVWKDQTEKRALYEVVGVREYWILHPESLDLAIYRLEGNAFAVPQGANLRAPVAVSLFPGLSLVADIDHQQH